MTKNEFIKKLVKSLSSKKKTLNKLAKTKKAVYLAGLFIILVALYVFRGLFVAAFVNGQPISRLSILTVLERRGGAEVLDSLITQALINQEAKRQNVSVTQVDIDNTIAEIEASLGGQGGLDQILASEGMTRDDLEEQIRLQKFAEKILADKIMVTDEEIKTYLETNSDYLPEDATDEEKNELARNQLQQQKLSSELQTWVADLKDKATINYFVNY